MWPVEYMKGIYGEYMQVYTVYLLEFLRSSIYPCLNKAVVCIDWSFYDYSTVFGHVPILINVHAVSCFDLSIKTKSKYEQDLLLKHFLESFSHI